jgi:hypothetical protein
MPNNPRLKAIVCTISRGGFSDERVFSFRYDGKEYSGVASRRHMWKQDGSPIEDGEPPVGQKIPGLVAARVIEAKGENRALISVPDGEVIEVPSGVLVDRPTAGVGQHVPI